MCKPLSILNLLCLCIEHFHEVASDNLTLLLWVRDACEVSKEFLTGIYTYHIKSETLVIFHHITELILAKHTMIYEDTCEMITDSLAEKHCCYAGIYAT